MTPDTHLPFRFRQSTFRFYEPAIRSIIEHADQLRDNPGTCLTLRFATGSVETHLNRIRDAITSLLTHHWPTDISSDRLVELRPFLRFSRGQDGSSVAVVYKAVAGTGNNVSLHAVAGGTGHGLHNSHAIQRHGEQLDVSLDRAVSRAPHKSSRIDDAADDVPASGVLANPHPTNHLCVFHPDIYTACLVLAKHSAFNIPITLIQLPPDFQVSECDEDFVMVDQAERTVTIYC